jgi:cytosine/adenosine deaminase-related metal-dependent hydrolase
VTGGPLVLRAGWVVPRAEVPPLREATVLVKDGRITAVGRDVPVPENAEVIDLGAAVLVPGLVNAHQHGRGISQLVMGYPDRPLEPWIAARRRHGPPDIHAVTRLAAEAMLAHGVTATLHANYTYASGDYAAELRAQIDAYRAAGLRATVCVGVQDRGGLVYPDGDASAFAAGLPADARALVAAPAPPPYAQDWDASLALMESLQAETADDPLVTLAWGPAGPQWVSDALWARIAADAVHRGVGVHFHLLESPAQAAAARRLYPEGTLARLRACGLFGARTSCAHGVHMTPADMDIAAAAGLTVVLNPGSNMRLSNGPPPVAALRAAGVRLALGTDNCALADDEDYLRELRLAALLGRTEPAMTPADEAAALLRMATADGAAAAFLPAGHGTIAPGAPADLAAFRIAPAGPDTPPDRLVELLLARGSGRDCVLTVVAGVVRFAARRTDLARRDHWRDRAAASVAARDLRAPAEAVTALQNALSAHYAARADQD